MRDFMYMCVYINMCECQCLQNDIVQQYAIGSCDSFKFTKFII